MMLFFPFRITGPVQYPCHTGLPCTCEEKVCETHGDDHLPYDQDECNCPGCCVTANRDYESWERVLGALFGPMKVIENGVDATGLLE